MAAIPTWQEHWQVPFMSLDGISYTLSIYEWDYQGSIVTLKGGPEPFVTQEDDDDDIFTPIRTQTGYISIVLDPSNQSEATILDDILPVNNRSRFVRLRVGDAVKWQGFLQSNMYSQPWEGSAQLVQIPVISMIGALESVTLAPAIGGEIKPLAGILTAGLAQLLVGDVEDPNDIVQSLVGDMYVIDDISSPLNCWIYQRLEWGLFMGEEKYATEYLTSSRAVGKAYIDILAEICTTYGLTLRESGKDIYFSAMDVASTSRSIWKWTWAQLKIIASGFSANPETSEIATTDMIGPSKGTDNVRNIQPGRNNVIIILSLHNSLALNLVPSTLERSDENVIDVANMYLPDARKLQVMPYPAPSTDREKYVYTNIDPSGQGSGITADYSTCITNSALGPNNLVAPARSNIITGALLCRTKYTDEREFFGYYTPGIYLSQRQNAYDNPPYSWTPQICYSINTERPWEINGGYLKLNMEMLNMWIGRNYVANEKYNFGAPVNYAIELYTMIVCKIKFGTKVWEAGRSGGNTGRDWKYTYGKWVEESAATTGTFQLLFNKSSLITNRGEWTGVDATDGYLIPIASCDDSSGSPVYTSITMRGIIEFQILNVQYVWMAATGSGEGAVSAPGRVIRNLNISHLADIVSGSDIYYREVAGTEFSKDATISTVIGTINKNAQYPNFLMKKNVDAYYYIENIEYVNGNATITERIEHHMLKRLKNHYAQNRHSYQLVLGIATETNKTKFQLGQSWYEGIAAKTDWINDNKIIKFFEL